MNRGRRDRVNHHPAVDQLCPKLTKFGSIRPGDEQLRKLGKISSRSRDNLPNPVTAVDPYVPANSPAIGDLMDMFDFTTHN